MAAKRRTTAGRRPCLRDCAVTKGQLHVPGCDVERCPACGDKPFPAAAATMATTDSRDLSFDRASLGPATRTSHRKSLAKRAYKPFNLLIPCPTRSRTHPSSRKQPRPKSCRWLSCTRPASTGSAQTPQDQHPQQLIRAGHDRATVLRSLKAYCTAPRYRASLQAGAARIDLCGQPAGVVTDKEAAHAARSRPARRRAHRRPRVATPDDTPIRRRISCPAASNSP